MKLSIVKIGKPSLSETAELAGEYLKRLKIFTPLDAIELKESQADAYFAKLAKGSLLVLLDEKGKEFTSLKFSEQIQKWMNDPGVKQLVFVIGGPYGFSDATKKLPHTKICLSQMTLQGDLAWVVLTEQIYRAFTILKRMDYHHE